MREEKHSYGYCNGIDYFDDDKYNEWVGNPLLLFITRYTQNLSLNTSLCC